MSDPATYNSHTLPEGFKWIPRYQYAPGELALILDGRYVAQLMKKVDGLSWYALLMAEPGVLAPYVFKDCASFASGKTGVELWARKYETKLRRGGVAED